MFWGGAAVGIGLPAKDAVNSLINEREIRKTGGTGQSAKDYENYGYGKDGFGDERTKLVSNGQGKTEIEGALKGVRSQGGKQDVGKGLEKEIGSGLQKKKICQNGNTNNCYVGQIEFIDNKNQSLFGRIPIKDGSELKNVYLKWMKCTQNTHKASAVGVGKFKKQSSSASTTSGQSNNQNKWKGCLNTQETKS